MNGIVDKARAWLARTGGARPALLRLQHRRNPSVTALMLGEHCLAVRVDSRPEGRLSVTAVSAGGPEVVTGWRKLAAGSQPVLVLGTAARHLLTVDRPQVPEAELAMAVRWPAAAAQEADPDQLLCTALELPQTGSAARHQMLAISAHVPAVQTQLQQLRAARLDVRSIDVIDSALLGMLRLQPATQDACVALMPATGSLCIALMWQGRFCALRTLALPASHPRDDADYRDTLALHVQRTVDIFERQATLLALRHVLMCLPSLSSHSSEAVAEALPLPVRHVHLQECLDIPPALAETLARHEDLNALACVAAARLLDTPAQAVPPALPEGPGRPAALPPPEPERKADGPDSQAPQPQTTDPRGAPARPAEEWVLQP